MGDDIQAIKAGIMEIGDIFVINKADRDGVYSTEKSSKRCCRWLRETTAGTRRS
jgi:putative protein kinase ArgK-like GTPase of G3E family